MKHKIKTYLFSALILAGSAVAAPLMASSVVYAADLSCGAQDNATDIGSSSGNDGNCAEKTAFSFGDCEKDQVGIECLADEILTFMSAVVGIAVVAGITAGGIMYSTSKGNPAGTQKGKTLIGNSVIGLVLYFLMYAIINFLIPGGVF